MEKQEKAQKLMKLIIIITGITFICLGLFAENILTLLHSADFLPNIRPSDLTVIKYVFFGMGAMDIIGAFLFPKFIGVNKF